MRSKEFKNKIMFSKSPNPKSFDSHIIINWIWRKENKMKVQILQVSFFEPTPPGPQGTSGSKPSRLFLHIAVGLGFNQQRKERNREG